MQQTSIEMSTKLGMTGWDSDPQRIVQEIEFWLYYQMVYAQIRIYPREWNVKFYGIFR